MGIQDHIEHVIETLTNSQQQLKARLEEQQQEGQQAEAKRQQDMNAMQDAWRVQVSTLHGQLASFDRERSEQHKAQQAAFSALNQSLQQQQAHLLQKVQAFQQMTTQVLDGMAKEHQARSEDIAKAAQAWQAFMGPQPVAAPKPPTKAAASKVPATSKSAAKQASAKQASAKQASAKQASAKAKGTSKPDAKTS